MKYFIGQKAKFSKVITKKDVLMFSEISGDKNPIHIDETYAKTTIFKSPIVHGLLCAGLISSVIANTLPGEGTIYLGQELKFLSPVFHNENLTAEVEIIEIIKDKKHLILKTIVKKDNDTIVISGVARVKCYNIK